LAASISGNLFPRPIRLAGATNRSAVHGLARSKALSANQAKLASRVDSRLQKYQGKKNILPDALLGRDPSQVLAAEQLRATGGASATEELLGLNQQPTMPGTILPPLGNDVALRHLTPTMRRELLRKLLDRQQRNARRLLAILPRDEEESDPERRRRRALPENLPAPEALALPEPQRQRAAQELHQSLRLLELIDRLMTMQDETLAQMSASAQR